jgi:hypothetical protein
MIKFCDGFQHGILTDCIYQRKNVLYKLTEVHQYNSASNKKIFDCNRATVYFMITYTAIKLNQFMYRKGILGKRKHQFNHYGIQTKENLVKPLR